MANATAPMALGATIVSSRVRPCPDALTLLSYPIDGCQAPLLTDVRGAPSLWLSWSGKGEAHALRRLVRLR